MERSVDHFCSGKSCAVEMILQMYHVFEFVPAVAKDCCGLGGMGFGVVLEVTVWGPVQRPLPGMFGSAHHQR